MSGSVNDDYEVPHDRLARLYQVLQEFLFFKRGFQFALAEAAMWWGLAALSEDPDSDTCQSCFFALSDALYLMTDESSKTHDATSGEQLSEAANADYKATFEPAQQAALRAMQVLRLMPDVDIRRSTTAESLFSLVSKRLEGVSPNDLAFLVSKCTTMSIICRIVRCGTISEQECNDRIHDVLTVVHRLHDDVSDRVASGRLTVIDGVIDDPYSVLAGDGDEDEDEE